MSVPAFTDVGLPTQPAVVFLHGVGGGRHGWTPQQAHVAQMGWRSLAWDMPGYGDSAMVTPYDFAHLAQALWQMLDASHIHRAVLVGHSMGAMVALQAWTQKPERITGLLLAASSPAFGNTDGDFQKQFLAQRLAPLEAGKTMGDMSMSMQADRDEDFNTRLASYHAWRKAIEKVKPIPRDTAQLNLSQLMRQANCKTTACAVDHLVSRFFSTPVSEAAKQQLSELLSDDLGTTDLNIADSYMEDALRNTLHVILSLPAYQLG